MRHLWAIAAIFVCALSWGGQRALAASEEFPVPPPPLSPDYYPCSNCHNESQKTDPKPRQLGEHQDIELHHAEQFRWCLDCHDERNRDKLHLQSGDRIDFSESYRLCGQCHGDKYRDWRAGIHGKRVGFWNGKKEYLLCAHCHNPHSPRFKPVKPEPPPEIDGSRTLRSHAPKATKHPAKKH
ncbi:MAG: hypothetical protein HY900_13710 [Deltaproteobacteria bacterium]|nr:hypothetical protein [Deltaproteobacteria bacterium]